MNQVTEIGISADGKPYDRSTGEALSPDVVHEVEGQVVVLEPIEAMISLKEAPIHIRKMQELGVPPAMFASYTQVPRVDVESIGAKKVTIVGAIVWFSGAYKPKPKPGQAPSDEYMPGYYKVLLKLKETRKIEVTIDRTVHDFEVNMVVASSSKSIAEFAYAMMQEHGWYDFRDGFECEGVFSGKRDEGQTFIPLAGLLPVGSSTGKGK